MASPLTVSKAENAVPGSYIITLKDGVSLASHVSSTQASIASTTSNITHEFNFINGYAGEFTDEDLNDLRSHPEIASIEQNSYIWLCGTTTQTNATWGLGRISSKDKVTGNPDALNFKYTYDSTAGKGVNIYVVDSGIDIHHPAFEGRASWGKTLGKWDDKDNNGHGTHCAGTAVSEPYGVAKASKVIAVKVMNIKEDGGAPEFIAGLEWIANEVARTGVPSVASISLGISPNIAIDSAVNKLYERGITVVVAAGNNNIDAINVSPARAEHAITVANSDINDTKAPKSNYGACVSIWAPGTNVISTLPGGGNGPKYGTSMACPHVAGFAACLLSIDSALTPAKIAKMIKDRALNNAISGVPNGTVNKLLHINPV